MRVIAEEKMFSGLGESFDVGRYHSWVVSRKNLPECLTVTAEDAAGRIMALSHKSYDVRGLQFHPESILTPMGKMMMANWLHAWSKGNVYDILITMKELLYKLVGHYSLAKEEA